MSDQKDVDPEMREKIEKYVKERVNEALNKGEFPDDERVHIESDIESEIRESMGHDGGNQDLKDISEILKVVGTEIPKLLESISNSLIGSESGEKYGATIAEFYKKLKDAGMDDKQAFEMAKEFMSNVSLGGIIKDMMGGMMSGKGRPSHHKDEGWD